MFTQECFIRKNTKELQDKLSKLGYDICGCCNFVDAKWLETSITKLLSIKDKPSVHGIGYEDEELNYNGYDTVDKRCNLFLENNENSENKAIDCGTNEDLFLAIAALRDDSDYMQWFVSKGWKDGFGNITDKWVLCTENTLEELGVINNSPNTYNRKKYPQFGWHKATVQELIEHFK